MKLRSSFPLLGMLGLVKPSVTASPAPSVERIRELFSIWETGQGLDFIDNVLAPDCKFFVPGSHRFAGVYDREGIKTIELEVSKMFQVPETIEIGRIFRDEKGDWVSMSMASKNESLLKTGKRTISTNILSAIDTIYGKTV